MLNTRSCTLLFANTLIGGEDSSIEVLLCPWFTTKVFSPNSPLFPNVAIRWVSFSVPSTAMSCTMGPVSFFFSKTTVARNAA